MIRRSISKEQKSQFSRGFFWGRLEHRLEEWCTCMLLLGILFQVSGILSRRMIYFLIASLLFALSLFFRLGAGIAHRIEKHYMDKLRFGRWRTAK